MKLRQKTREALLWGAGFKVFRDALQFCVMLAMVRLLAPEDYGKWGLLASVTGFFALASAKTFFAHILQVRRDEDVHIQDHFTAGALIQAVIFLMVNGAAIVLRNFETYRSIAPLLHLASLGLLIELPGELWARVLERRLEFRRQRVLLGVGLVVVAAGSLFLALSGVGVLALVIPPLVISVPFAWDFLGRERFRPTWKLDRGRYRLTLRFGIARIGSGGLNGIRDLAQSALVVRFAGFESLGYFGRALGLGNLFCAGIASQLVVNVYPVLTRHEACSPGFRRAASLMLRGVAWVVLPAAAVLALYAGPAVHLVYGAKWDPVVPILPIAMVESLTRALALTIYTILLAASEHRRCFQQDLLVMLLVLGALMWGLPLGVETYLGLLAAAEAVGAILMLSWLIRSDGMSFAGLLTALGPPLLGGVLAGAASWVSGRAIIGAADGVVPVAVGAILFALTYAAAMRLFFGRWLAELLGYLPGGDTAARLLRIESGDPSERSVSR